MPIAEARGGAEALLERLAGTVTSNSTTRNGLCLSFIFLEDGPMARRLEADGFRVRVVDAGRLRDLGRFWTTVRTIATELTRHPTDVVVSWMTKAHLYAGLAARRANVPAVWYQHGIPSATDPVTRLATLIPAAGILACSDVIASAQASLRPYRRVIPVPPCVDLSRFSDTAVASPNEARRALGLPPDGPLVGIVARMQRWKGVHVYVDAMTRVLETRPDARGVIVGGPHDLEPGYAAEIDRRIDERGIGDRVVRVGFQPDVPTWMQAMDVVVHASEFEPFGMVIIEAMALGKPVVAGADGGPREIITDGVNGFLADYGDDRGLADRILAYLTNPSLRYTMGSAARQRAAAFSTSAYADRFADALDQIVPAYASLPSTVSVA